jgi:tetratricopeptide (TPR) repeat protein
MLRLNSLIVGLLISSCLSTAAGAATINTNSNKDLNHTLLAQSTQAGRQQEAFARYANTLHLQHYDDERRRQSKERFLSLVEELNRRKDYIRLGRLLYSQGYVDIAFNIYSKAIDTDPKSSEGYYGRAIIRNRYRKDFVGALADFNRAIEIDPENSADAHYNRAIAKKNLGDMSGAIQDFRRAVKFYKSAGDIEFLRLSIAHLRSLGVSE